MKKTPIDNIHNLKKQLHRIYRGTDMSENFPWMPLAKFRGQRRYFEQLRETSATFQLNLSPDNWFDRWHWHPDMPGYSNLSYKFLRSHLFYLNQAFQNVLKQAEGSELPYQTWLLINEGDFSQNALYFHRPPGNPADFPLKIKNAELDATPPFYLAAILKYSNYRVAKTVSNEIATYFIYSENHGISLFS